MNAKDIIDVLKKRWYLLIIIPIIFGAATALYSFMFIPNEYTNTVPLYVWQHVDSYSTNQNNSNNNNSANNNPDVNNRKNVQGDLSFNNLIAGDVSTYIKSNMVTKAVLEELGLSSLGGYKITTDRDSTDSNSSSTSRVIKITVSGPEPVMVAKIANCYAKKTSEIVAKFLNVDAINVLEEATPSSSPSGPPRNLYIAMALAAGFCIALIIILIFSYFDSSIKNKKELEKAFKLPVLAQIPYIKRAHKE